MTQKNRVLKILVFIAVASYFAYTLYWFLTSVPYIIGISLNPSHYSPPAGLRIVNSYSISVSYFADYVGFLGLAIRIAAASYALSAAYLTLKTEKNILFAVRSKVSKALIFEGIYFLAYIPSIYYLPAFSALFPISRVLLSTQLVIQILLISPLLILLGLKVKKYQSTASNLTIPRLAALSSMNYVVALWITYMLKWTEMDAVVGVGFKWLMTPPYVKGFLNTTILLTMAAVFVIIGFISFLRKSSKTIKWWGLSAIFLSTYFMVYVVYLASVDGLYYAPLGELWVIPLIGLGSYLLLKKPDNVAA